MTHRFIHSLLENRHSSLQFLTLGSECRLVDMDAYTVFTNIAIAGIFINGIIVVVGIIGNSLSFVVFWKGNFKSSTSFLFLSLSLIDSTVLMTAFTCCIVRLHVFIDFLPQDLRVYLVVCVWPLRSMAESATIWVTVLIAVNRYIIVCLPLRASQWCTLSKVKIQLAVVLVVVVLYNIPEIVRRRVIYITRNNGTSYVADIDYTMNHSFRPFYIVYDIVLHLIVKVCLPLFILTLFTIRLIKAMKAHRRMQADMQRQHSQPDSSMTFALIIVVIVFIICRAPLLIYCVIWLKGWWSLSTWHYVNIMYSTLLTLNSAVNFVIYILVNRRFRNVLLANVCRRRSAIPVVNADIMANNERAKRETVDGRDTRL